LHSPQRTLPEYELALGDYARQVLKGVTDQLRTILSDVLLAPTPPPVKSELLCIGGFGFVI
jgi:hypothetical protein